MESAERLVLPAIFRKRPAFRLDPKNSHRRVFELYTFSFCQNLIDSAGLNCDSMIVGWDTRDPKGIFSDAAIRGIRKSGLTAVSIEFNQLLVWPFISFHEEAAGAVVLTASHNPSDQNGIKIFLGHTGLKLFPADDIRLTKTIYSTDFKHLKKTPLQGDVVDEEVLARKFFKNVMLDSFNSWVSERRCRRLHWSSMRRMGLLSLCSKDDPGIRRGKCDPLQYIFGKWNQS